MYPDMEGLATELRFKRRESWEFYQSDRKRWIAASGQNTTKPPAQTAPRGK